MEQKRRAEDGAEWSLMWLAPGKDLEQKPCGQSYQRACQEAKNLRFQMDHSAETKGARIWITKEF